MGMRSNSGRELPLPPLLTTEINEQVYDHVGSTRHNKDMDYINDDNDLAQDYPRIPSCYEEPISIMKSLPNEN